MDEPNTDTRTHEELQGLVEDILTFAAARAARPGANGNQTQGAAIALLMAAAAKAQVDAAAGCGMAGLEQCGVHFVRYAGLHYKGQMNFAINKALAKK